MDCKKCSKSMEIVNTLDGRVYKCITGCNREYPIKDDKPKTISEIDERFSGADKLGPGYQTTKFGR